MQANPFLEGLGIADVVEGRVRRERPPMPPPGAPGMADGRAPGGDPTAILPPGTAPGAASQGPPAVDETGSDALSPARTMAQQGPAIGRAERFTMPEPSALADAWHRIRLIVADNPAVAKQWEPKLNGLRDLAFARQAASFEGDPMASPDEAAKYARHMGSLVGRFGEPMPAREAAGWNKYLDASRMASVGKAKQSLVDGNLAQLNQHVASIAGGDWQVRSIEQGSYDLAGTQVPAMVATLVGPDGQEKVINSVELELQQASLESKLKIVEAQNKAEAAKQARENPAPAATTEMTPTQKTLYEQYGKERLKIWEADVTPEVQERLFDSLNERYAPQLGGFLPTPRLMTPEEQRILGLPGAPTGAGPGAAQEGAVASGPGASGGAGASAEPKPASALERVTANLDKAATLRETQRQARENQARIDQQIAEAKGNIALTKTMGDIIPGTDPTPPSEAKQKASQRAYEQLVALSNEKGLTPKQERDIEVTLTELLTRYPQLRPRARPAS